MPSHPCGKLHSTYVSALTVVCAALGNKNFVSVLQAVQNLCTAYGCFKVALIARKQNRKGR